MDSTKIYLKIVKIVLLKIQIITLMNAIVFIAVMLKIMFTEIRESIQSFLLIFQKKKEKNS